MFSKPLPINTETVDPDFNYRLHIESLAARVAASNTEKASRNHSFSCSKGVKNFTSPFDHINGLQPTREELLHKLALLSVQTNCGCKRGFCLRQVDTSMMDYTNSVNMVLRNRRSMTVHAKHPEGKYRHMMELFKNSIVAVENTLPSSGSVVKPRLVHKFQLSVDDSLTSQRIDVCRTAFFVVLMECPNIIWRSCQHELSLVKIVMAESSAIRPASW